MLLLRRRKLLLILLVAVWLAGIYYFTTHMTVTRTTTESDRGERDWESQEFEKRDKVIENNVDVDDNQIINTEETEKVSKSRKSLEPIFTPQTLLSGEIGNWLRGVSQLNIFFPSSGHKNLLLLILIAVVQPGHNFAMFFSVSRLYLMSSSRRKISTWLKTQKIRLKKSTTGRSVTWTRQVTSTQQE